MLFFRKIIFYIFTAVYIILCPALILYAFGYLYTPGTVGGVVKTGLISLSTAPDEANVYMSGRKYSKKTPAILRELLPGDYDIKIKLKGYRDWERTVSVKEEKAAVFESILLLPESWEKNISVHGKFSEMIVLPGTNLLILSESDKLGDHMVYDRVKEKSWPLLEAASSLKEHKYLSSFTSDGDPSILVHAAAERGETYFWFHIKEGENTVKDVTRFFSVRPSDVKWTPGHPDYIFSLQDRYLNRIDIKAGSEYPRYIENVKGYGIYKEEIYVLGTDDTFTKMGFDKPGEEIIVKKIDNVSSIFSGEEHYNIKIPEKDLILFIGAGGELLVNKLPYRFADEGVLGIEMYSDNKKVLIWKKDRIGILDLDEERIGSVEFEQEPSVNWVYTKGRNIEQCFLIYDDSHVLFLDGKTLFIMPVDGDDDGGVSKVFTLKEKSYVYYSEDTGKVYFVQASGGGLSEAEIVPKESLIPMTILEDQRSEVIRS